MTMCAFVGVKKPFAKTGARGAMNDDENKEARVEAWK